MWRSTGRRNAIVLFLDVAAKVLVSPAFIMTPKLLVSSRAVDGNFGSLPNTLLLSNIHYDENRLQALSYLCLEVRSPHSPV